MYDRTKVLYSRVLTFTGDTSGSTEGIFAMSLGAGGVGVPQEGVIYQLSARVYGDPTCILPYFACQIIQRLQEI
jgi:hypothetical protein